MKFGNLAVRVLQAVEKPKNAVVFLHGIGGEKPDFVASTEKLSLKYPETRFVYPQAPFIPLACYGELKEEEKRKEMRGDQGEEEKEAPAWFDMQTRDVKVIAAVDIKEDMDGMHEASDYVEQLVASEASMLGEQGKVYLGGHSQGASLALFSAIRMAALRPDHPLGGLFLFNGYISGIKEIATKYAPMENLSLPEVLYAFGLGDNLIAPELQMAGVYYLRQLFEFNKFNVRGYRDATHNEIDKMMADAVAKLIGKAAQHSKSKPSGGDA